MVFKRVRFFIDSLRIKVTVERFHNKNIKEYYKGLYHEKIGSAWEMIRKSTSGKTQERIEEWRSERRSLKRQLILSNVYNY